MSLIIKNLKILARKNKYMEIMAYIIQNNLAKYFNFSGDTLDLDLDKKIERSNQVFDSYLKMLGKETSFLKDKNILEIGSGNNFLIALQFLSFGAKRVVLMDRFNCLDDDRFNQRLYKKFIRNLTVNGRHALKDIIVNIEGKITFPTPQIQYIQGCALEDAENVLNERFDIILSNAVLEHTSDLELSFKALKYLGRPNSLSVHSVDLKNHQRFQNVHPLYFLTFSDWLWDAMSSNLGSPNRSRFNHYEKLFEKYDFEVANIIKEKFDYDEEYLLSIKSKFIKRFRDLDDELLKIMSFKVLLKNK